MDRLADLWELFRSDPSGLRWTLEDELAEELDIWARAPGKYAEAQAYWATCAWLALAAYRFWVLARSSRSTISMLGPDMLERYTTEAERLEAVAIATGDWAWAYERLREWMAREIP